MMRPTKMTWQERNAWEAERAALIAATLADVATLIGWELRTDEAHGKQLQLSCGDRAIHTYFDAWHDRLVLHGRFPYHLLRHRIGSGIGADIECQITVAPTRSAAVIAREIGSRLMPAYEELWAAYSERERVWVVSMRQKEGLAQRIALNGNGSVVEPVHYAQHDKDRRQIAYFGAKSISSAPWGKAEVSDYQKLHVKMELHNVPPELAEYIASLLGEWGDDS